ncbi:MAG: phage Gp37/Gp68 family protein [SAR324 cluster bacterium]|nr:phage Gp37/Gp68 family protein [SAR324 cluster bacterium]
MSINSPIEWTETTWNPLTGCTKISPGCKHCYADRLSRRLMAMGNRKYSNGFDLTLHQDAVRQPLSWKKPQTVFVNSMSDLFQDGVPLKFIQQVFSVMNEAHRHRFQILTKRSENLLQAHKKLQWGPNIWMGVSVESKDFKYRITHLRRTGAQVRFLSLEPLLGRLGKLNLKGMDWVIVGGESGPGARPMDEDWVVEIRDQCQHANVPFFFKQWGGTNKKKTGRVFEGRTWDDMPDTAVAAGGD